MVLAALLFLQLAAPGQLIDVGGHRLHLYCTGQGSPTVMIAGAGFSFDWTLVQTEVSKFTRVCTYDAAGTAWSDPAPRPQTCTEKARDVHSLLRKAAIPGPYVIVGLSLGAVVARLFGSEYPREVAGMVIVDHAFLPAVDGEPRPQIQMNLEDDPNYARLPERNREMRRWAMSRNPALPTPQSAAACVAEAEAADSRFPRDLPLFVISTGNEESDYLRLQTSLLSLSGRSRQVIADKSYHPVHIDQPEVIVQAIRELMRKRK